MFISVQFFVHEYSVERFPALSVVVVVALASCASIKIETLYRTMVRFLSLHLSIEKLIIKRESLHSYDMNENSKLRWFLIFLKQNFCISKHFTDRCWHQCNLDSFTRLLLKYLLNSEDKYDNMQVQPLFTAFDAKELHGLTHSLPKLIRGLKVYCGVISIDKFELW